MTGSLGRLSLRPGERRVVVAVGLVLFAVFNVVFIWPYFGQRKVAQEKLKVVRQKLERYQAEVKEYAKYKSGLEAIQSENPDVPLEDQSFKLGGTIYGQASKDGVNIMGAPSATTKTNEFFVQQAQKVTFGQTGEAELVSFLYDLGSGESLIRVQSLTVRPEPPARQRLGGDVTLVASYQRKHQTKATAVATAAPRPIAASAPPATKPGAAIPPLAKPIRKPGSGPTGARAAATNAPPPASWWGKVKGWFGGSSNSPAVASPTAAKPPVPAAVKK